MVGYILTDLFPQKEGAPIQATPVEVFFTVFLVSFFAQAEANKTILIMISALIGVDCVSDFVGTFMSF